MEVVIEPRWKPEPEYETLDYLPEQKEEARSQKVELRDAKKAYRKEPCKKTRVTLRRAVRREDRGEEKLGHMKQKRWTQMKRERQRDQKYELGEYGMGEEVMVEAVTPAPSAQPCAVKIRKCRKEFWCPREEMEVVIEPRWKPEPEYETLDYLPEQKEEARSQKVELRDAKKAYRKEPCKKTRVTLRRAVRREDRGEEKLGHMKQKRWTQMKRERQRDQKYELGEYGMGEEVTESTAAPPVAAVSQSKPARAVLRRPMFWQPREEVVVSIRPRQTRARSPDEMDFAVDRRRSSRVKMSVRDAKKAYRQDPSNRSKKLVRRAVRLEEKEEERQQLCDRRRRRKVDRQRQRDNKRDAVDGPMTAVEGASVQLAGQPAYSPRIVRVGRRLFWCPTEEVQVQLTRRIKACQNRNRSCRFGTRIMSPGVKRRRASRPLFVQRAP